MLQSKKRRLSISPERTQPRDTPEPKKRKINNVAASDTSSSSIAGPSRPRVARSSPLLTSDSSVTLDSDSPPLTDKGKGKAVEKDPIMLELEQLRKEVAQKNELLEKSEKAATAIIQTLACHVCLETMAMPYALHCGHMACQTCLVSWFTSTNNNPDDGNNADNHDPGFYSDEASDPGAAADDDDEADSIGDLVILPNNNQNLNGNGAAHPPAPAPPAPAPPAPAPTAPAPAQALFPNAAKPVKTCPHCRCIIKQRPIQIYPVKDILGILGPWLEPETIARSKKDEKDSAGKDPWEGLFRPGLGHSSDDSDDDDPWHGFDGHQHPAMPPLHADDAHPEEGLSPPPPPPPGPLPPPPPPFVDEEDGVRRCGACMHEIWSGECTNAHCGIVYDDQSEDSDDGVRILVSDNAGDEDSEGLGHHGYHSDAGDGDVEDGYESSFIDDGDNRRGSHRRPRQSYFPFSDRSASDVEVPDDDFLPGPSRRYTRGREAAIVISSDDQESDIQMPRRARRGRLRQIIEVDDEVEEQEVEGDVRSAEESNYPVDHFALDALVNEHLRTGPPAVPYIEEDEEDYGNGEYPYVWDEEDEDVEGNDRDDVVYQEEDNDTGDGYES